MKMENIYTIIIDNFTDKKILLSINNKNIAIDICTKLCTIDNVFEVYTYLNNIGIELNDYIKEIIDKCWKLSYNEQKLLKITKPRKVYFLEIPYVIQQSPNDDLEIIEYHKGANQTTSFIKFIYNNTNYYAFMIRCDNEDNEYQLDVGYFTEGKIKYDYPEMCTSDLNPKRFFSDYGISKDILIECVLQLNISIGKITTSKYCIVK